MSSITETIDRIIDKLEILKSQCDENTRFLVTGYYNSQGEIDETYFYFDKEENAIKIRAKIFVED